MKALTKRTEVDNDEIWLPALRGPCACGHRNDLEGTRQLGGDRRGKGHMAPIAYLAAWHMGRQGWVPGLGSESLSFRFVILKTAAAGK